jgi:hypothetical protein
MSEQNPFAVSEHASGGHYADADPNLDPSFRQLIQLPWVRLLGILTLIVAAFMLIGGGFMVLAVARVGGSGSVVVSGIYLASAFLYIYPAMCLMKYASSITEASATGRMAHVNKAILQQKKFWRFCGILA